MSYEIINPKDSNLELKNAILFFAKLFNKEEKYNNYLKTYFNMYPIDYMEVIKSLLLDMAINKFNPYNCTHKEYNQYQIIFQYIQKTNNCTL